MAQNLKTFNQSDKNFDCYSAVLILSEYKGVETELNQYQLKRILENPAEFDLIPKLSQIQSNDIIIFQEKQDGLNPYKHAYVVKNSKRETLLTRPIMGQKVTLTNLNLEMKRKKTPHFKTLVFRQKQNNESNQQNQNIIDKNNVHLSDEDWEKIDESGYTKNQLISKYGNNLSDKILKNKFVFHGTVGKNKLGEKIYSLNDIENAIKKIKQSKN